MYLLESFKLSDTKEFKIFYDETPENPRSWDNISTMICFHRRYNLGDNHDYNSSDYDNWNELKKQIEKDHDIAVILPLYLYDHSGITISTSPFSCDWDSGQVGFIFITKDQIRSNWNIKRVTKKWIDRATEILESDVKTYDQYLTGDTYGFQVIEKTICECGHVEENELDSCWGFFGTDWKENGILEYLSKEEREIIEQQL